MAALRLAPLSPLQLAPLTPLAPLGFYIKDNVDFMDADLNRLSLIILQNIWPLGRRGPIERWFLQVAHHFIRTCPHATVILNIRQVILDGLYNIVAYPVPGQKVERIQKVPPEQFQIHFEGQRMRGSPPLRQESVR